MFMYAIKGVIMELILIYCCLVHVMLYIFDSKHLKVIVSESCNSQCSAMHKSLHEAMTGNNKKQWFLVNIILFCYRVCISLIIICYMIYTVFIVGFRFIVSLKVAGLWSRTNCVDQAMSWRQIHKGCNGYCKLCHVTQLT